MRLNEFFHDREAVSSDSEQSDHNNSYDEHSFHMRKSNNIVIFEEDKGGAVAVMNKTDHITEARNYLNSVDDDGNRIYKELTFDCTDKNHARREKCGRKSRSKQHH